MNGVGSTPGIAIRNSLVPQEGPFCHGALSRRQRGATMSTRIGDGTKGVVIHPKGTLGPDAGTTGSG